MTDRPSMLDIVRPFVEAGFAIHWLKAKSKAPVGNDWSSAPVASMQDLSKKWFEGANVGVRLGEHSKVAGGFLYVLDLDIRVEAKQSEAIAKLAAMFPNFTDLPIVISGSGGASRHLYFVTDKVFAGRKLAQSDGFKMVFDANKDREVKKRDWEIELFGTGKQVAMPPSIHPDTGVAYRWHKEFDFDLIECGIAPFIASSAIESLLGVSESDTATEEKPVLGMTIGEAQAIVDDLPLDEWCEDRDGWFRVGMALHHEFAGSDEAFALWDAFSRKSAKFDGKNQRQVWRSFKGKSNPVRMATLLQAAKHVRMMRGFEDESAFDEPAPAAGRESKDSATANDEFDDLLGGNEKDEPTGLEWMRLLDLNEEGVIKATLHNLELVVGNDLRTSELPRYNLFTQEVVQRGSPGTKPQRARAQKPTRQLVGATWSMRDTVNGDLWTDDKDNAIRSVFEAPKTQGGYSLKISDRDLRSAIDNVARCKSFHPVREFLSDLKWDGVARLETLFIRYLGAPDSPYSRSVARLTLVAAVTRVFEPGHKFDYALILEGMQGKRKSTFINILAKKWFAELDGDFHDTKQMVELMQGAWILEIPELTGFSRSDVRAIKAFISRRTDKVRLAYAKRAQQFDRQAILIGSTNDKEYLRDDTGGRRFWPMACNLPDDQEIDTDALAREIDHVWAEAVEVYRAMRIAQPHGTLPLTITDKAALSIAVQLQESRRVETAADALAGQIEAWLDEPVSISDFESSSPPQPRDATCLMQLWVECLGNDKKSYNQQAAQQVASGLKNIRTWGIWNSGSGKMTFGGFGRQRAYTRLSASVPLPVTKNENENFLG